LQIGGKPAQAEAGLSQKVRQVKPTHVSIPSQKKQPPAHNRG
jgi:hypothetical protein